MYALFTLGRALCTSSTIACCSLSPMTCCSRPRPIKTLISNARPGCRFAVLGARFLPWSWGFPINLFVAVRARHYLSTFRGFRHPYNKLRHYAEEFEVVRTFHFGTSYLAVGVFTSPRAEA